ncbi:facilitated trehalose transporter Tret1-2 homolog [Ostrinia furnacalis]|uniref:facilitated trehalose transporter Tret1-2 homolog n=1 Tax=Ostrinia furnacalis TaxID=93504 RepID=UPI00103DEE87|nr:facilitated trehalose transporter Tret1-2 homolog [Ostrinia furnacalis]
MTVGIGAFIGAYSLTWVSYTAPLLESEASPLGVVMTKSQTNVMTSVVTLGSMVAALTTGQLPELVGRKKSELICGLLCVLSWALIASAHSVTQIIIARFILGYGVGIHLVVVFTYINEICQAFIRGTMASIPLFTFSIGALVSYITGWVCSYDVIIYLNLSVCVLFVLLLTLMKESPVYLITKNETKEALTSLKFYRGTSKTTTAVLEEFEYLKTQRQGYTKVNKDDNIILEHIGCEKEKEGSADDISPWKILRTSKPTQRAIITLTAHVIITAFMGAMAVQAYAVHFFLAAAPDLSPHLCSVILAVAIVIGNILAVLCTDLVGRRLLLISTCAICTICLGVLVGLLRWSGSPAWAVPLVMLLYSCAFQAGVNNVPLVQLSESFSPKVKSLASSIVMSSTCFSNFALLSIFSLLVDHLGLDGTFLMFCVISAAATVLTFLTAKETKGIRLEEIQGMYERGFLYYK